MIRKINKSYYEGGDIMTKKFFEWTLIIVGGLLGTIGGQLMANDISEKAVEKKIKSEEED